MSVQTAGASAPSSGAELTVFCVEDMQTFRAQVFAAKRALAAGGGAPAGAAKYVPDGATENPAAGLLGGGGGGDAGRALAVLERIERVLGDAVAEARAARKV